MAFIMLYVTCRDQPEADRIGAELLRERLIACVNVYSMNSQYWWKGVIEQGPEWVAIMKTQQKLMDQLEDRIRQLHSYETPCIIRWTVEANADYEAWIIDETGG